MNKRTLELKKEFYIKQNGYCYWCDRKLYLYDSLKRELFIPENVEKAIKMLDSNPNIIIDGVLDHIFPKSLGGLDEKDNYVLSCNECNDEKKNKIWIKNKDGTIIKKPTIDKKLVSVEITIAYGNEVQLTTTGKNQKQVFLKISPAFREKQLRQLKGALLSIFICYALHSDEYGYTWVDDRAIKKETGYSITSEIRQKLIRLKFLYQERLYDEKGCFRDWIYRIFQPCENGKEFVIRGIKQSVRLQGEKPYIGKNPISGKDGGIIEVEPFIKEEPLIVSKTNNEVFNYKTYLETLKNDKRRQIHLIGLYWEYKGYQFENKQQAESELKRDLRPANALEGYSDEQIIDTMDWLIDNTDFKWTMESILKFINEPLAELEPIRTKMRRDNNY